MRATVEFPCEFGAEGLAQVDNIVFEPASSNSATATAALTLGETSAIARPLKLEDALPGGFTPSQEVVLLQSKPAVALLEIGKAQLMLHGPGQDQFKVHGSIELGAVSDGIDVLSEEVIVTFDGFSETIPAGRFRCTDSGDGKKKCEFKGTAGGITEMEIAIGEGGLGLQVQGAGLDLSGTDTNSPVPVLLQLGDDLGVTEIRFGPEIVVNDFTKFTPIKSTFNTTSDIIGCPAGFVGKFGFTARFTNVSESVFSSLLFSSLVVQVATLTNGNLLQNADGGPTGVGARLPFPGTDGFADGVLSPQEFVDIRFIICLKEKKPFTFFVDALGVSR